MVEDRPSSQILDDSVLHLSLSGQKVQAFTLVTVRSIRSGTPLVTARSSEPVFSLIQVKQVMLN